MKKQRAEAKYGALTNAAEFIRNHGEEGGQNQEDYSFPLELYFSEAAKIADMLDKKAEKHRAKYQL